jgi:UDP-glucose 4-epimerase
MNILLTGGAGYIGSHSAVVLAEAGHRVILLDNFCNSNKSVISRLEKILGKPLVCIEADVRDRDLLNEALAEYCIDGVIHFAGLKAVGESIAMPIEYYANNVQGTINLLEAMKESNVKNLIFSSSATVYGDPQYLPIDESHPTGATNSYGRSKLHIEEMLKDVAASDPEWKIMCLRYFNPVGAHESGLIGEKPSGKPNNLAPFVAQVAAGKLPKLSVYGDDYSTPDGTGVRDYIHVMDLAYGHNAALNYMAQHFGWAAVNLGTGQGYSVLDLIKAFRDASGQPIPYEVVERRTGDIATSVAKAQKAKDLFNWQARYSLHDMCTSSWHWQKNSI